MIKKNDFKAFLLATILIGVMVLMKPVQDTGDDAFIAWQLSRGIGSIGSFISPYLSLLVSAFYEHIPKIAWWSVIHIMSAWVLMGVLIHIILKQYKGKDRLILYMILFVGIWISIVERVNFTRTAAGFAIAGIILIISYLYDENVGGKRYNLSCILCGYSLYILGCMIRFQAGLMILPFMLIYGFLKINDTHKNGKVHARVVEKFIVLFSLFVVSAMLLLSQYIFWELHPEWKAYNEYNSVRSSIVDYVDKYPTWEQAERQYIECGLKEENDLRLLFDKAFVGDTEVYSLETLQNIQKLSKNEVGIKEKMKSTYERVQQMFAEGRVFPWLILLLIYFCVITSKKKKMVFFLYLSAAFAILGVFSFLGRMMLRVWEPILLCVISMCIVYFDTSTNIKNSYKSIRTIEKSVVIIIGIVLWFYTGMSQDFGGMGLPSYSDDRDEITRARAEYIEANADKIYLLSQPLIHHSPSPGFFGIWEPLPENYCNNYFALSNWDSRTPTNLHRLNEIGIDNPVKALFERKNVYSEFMDGRLFDFIKCHYNKNITCSFVDEFGDNGAIVQYTAPIKEAMINYVQNCDVTEIMSQISDHYSIQTWELSGNIEGIDNDNHEALYCNVMKKNGQIFTFRLAYDGDGGFYAYLFDVNEAWMSDVEQAYFVELKKDGRYSKLSDIDLLY